MSIRLGLTNHDSTTGVDKNQLSEFILNQKEQSGWFVEDPFDLCHNLAGNCTPKGKERILKALKHVTSQISGVGTGGLGEIFQRVSLNSLKKIEVLGCVRLELSLSCS